MFQGLHKSMENPDHFKNFVFEAKMKLICALFSLATVETR